MRTNRERTSRDTSRERGIVGLVLLGLIVVAMAVAAFFFVARKQNDNAAADTQSTSSGGASLEESALQRNQVNTARRNDASRLLSATAEYQANNAGSMPTQMYGSMLDGMGYYKTATIASGEQSAVTTDELRLVTGAECGQNGATVEGSSSRMYAVQFALKGSGGSLTPQCENN